MVRILQTARKMSTRNNGYVQHIESSSEDISPPHTPRDHVQTNGYYSPPSYSPPHHTYNNDNHDEGFIEVPVQPDEAWENPPVNWAGYRDYTSPPTQPSHPTNISEPWDAYVARINTIPRGEFAFPHPRLRRHDFSPALDYVVKMIHNEAVRNAERYAILHRHLCWNNDCHLERVRELQEPPELYEGVDY